jgi:hypothetical protein
MYQIADGTAESIQRCCPQGLKDPIMIQMCNLGSYIQGKRRGVGSFIDFVPSDKSSAHSLWVLDDVAFARGTETKGHTPFAPLGPVSTYIEELYRLVLSGNQEALRKFLVLSQLSNGDAGEQIEGDIEKILLHYPEIAAVNWKIIKAYPSAIEMVKEMMEDNDRQQAVKGILHECSAKNLDCDGLSSALK